MVTLQELRQHIYEMSTAELDLYFLVVSLKTFDSLWEEVCQITGVPEKPADDAEPQRNITIDGRVVIPWVGLNDRPGFAFILKKEFFLALGVEFKDERNTDVEAPKDAVEEHLQVLYPEAPNAEASPV